MTVYFKSAKLQRIGSEQKYAVKQIGAEMAKKLGQRVMELAAAETLADLSRLPPTRCHELTGNRLGQLSVDLVHPYRLLFIPADDPVPRKPDGGLDWSRVTAVEIIEIADTH